MKLNVCVYLCAKFQVSSLILTSFKLQGEGRGGEFSPPPTSKRTPKKPTRTRVNNYIGQKGVFNFIVQGNVSSE